MAHRLSLDGLWEADILALAQLNREGGFLEANARWCELYGVEDPAEVARLRISDILAQPEQEHVSTAMVRQVAAGQRQGYTFEREFRRRDGSTFHARVFVAPRYDDGELTGMTSVVVPLGE